MRSFRDLEVYAKTLECAVAVASSVRKMVPEFLHNEGMTNCALSIPLWIAEAHSIRFADRKESIALLEKAMAGCNKMVVYFEEATEFMAERARSARCHSILNLLMNS